MHHTRSIDRIREHASEIRDRFSVSDLRVFGSVARGDADAGSDVDLVVTFEGGATFDRFMDLKFYLEELLGMHVDLVTRAAVRPELRTQIEREAIRVA